MLSIIISMSLLMTVICFYIYRENYMKETFKNSYYDSLSLDMMETSKENIKHNLSKTVDSIKNNGKYIEEETQSYNDELCKFNSTFYKLNPENKINKGDGKTLLYPNISKNGIFSSKENKCVEANDPLFQLELNCDKKYTCNNGIKINGTKVINNYKLMCEYNCE